MRVGSLFAGQGGFDLAARWMGWSTAWYSEIEPWACRTSGGDPMTPRGEEP